MSKNLRFSLAVLYFLLTIVVANDVHYCVLGTESPGKEMSIMGDKLVLKGLKFYGFHGFIPEEIKMGQWYVVDIDAYTSLKKAGVMDKLSDSVSYVGIYDIAKEVIEGPPKNILEAVAELIASRTLEKFPQITAVQVKLSKPNVPLIKSALDYIGIQIFRQRNTA